MPLFQRMPIRHKFTLVILLTSSAALLLACATFLYFDFTSYRRELVEQAMSLAGVIGNNCTAAVDFKDSRSAEETLAALKEEPSIAAAFVYDQGEALFAGYQRETEGSRRVQPILPARPGHAFTNSHLVLSRPILQQGEPVGTIVIISDLGELSERLKHFLFTVALVFLCSLSVAYVLSNWMQRLITSPVQSLARAARSVAVKQDYGVRVDRRSHDELGQLTDDFNEMLAQIQKRDTDLQAARDQLEHRVEERTRELAYERDLLKTLMDHFPDSIFFKDLQSRFVRAGRFKLQKCFALSLKKFRENHAAGEPLPGHLISLEAYSKYLPGKSDFDFLQDDDARRQFEEEQEIIRTGKGIEGKLEHQTDRAGVNAWYLSTKLPWTDKDGRIIGTFGTTKDITGMKQAEARLAYAHDLLQTLLNNLPDSIYFKDLESRFVRLSRSKAGESLALLRSQYRLDHPDEAEAQWPAHLSGIDEMGAWLLGKTDFDVYADPRANTAYEEEQEIIRTGEAIVGRVERVSLPDGKVVWHILTKLPWRDKEGRIIGTYGTAKDITSIKEAEAKMESLHQQLLETSRQAGMAEVATSVLHNVGNVLNSVNVSASVMVDLLKSSRLTGLKRLAAMFEENKADLPGFLAGQDRAQHVVKYVKMLSEQLGAEQSKLLSEVGELTRNIDHIKEIVVMQQNYARISGVTEIVNIPDLVEDSLRMNASALARHDIRLTRDFQTAPSITIEKHKVLQILINLIRNAKYACEESGNPDKEIVLRIAQSDRAVSISVSDNGVGIPAENLTRIFGHGFTTRKHGHGFGLHSGALAAREMGGALRVESPGAGKGATFTLELPIS